MVEDSSLRGKMSKQSEETIGKLAAGMMENPVVTGAASAAFAARGKAIRAQEAAMGALNLPSASDMERLTRRVRSVSQRLEAIEEGLDRVSDRVQVDSTAARLEERLAAIESSLARIEIALAERDAPPAGD